MEMDRFGKLLKDPALYDNANKLVANGNQLVADVNAGKGHAGQACQGRALAKKIDDTITRLNSITAQLDEGKGTAGKFLRIRPVQQCQRSSGGDAQSGQGRSARTPKNTSPFT